LIRNKLYNTCPDTGQKKYVEGGEIKGFEEKEVVRKVFEES
jgi:hypothetical protein